MIAVLLSGALFEDPITSAQEPPGPAADARARKLVRQMIAAAGGMERWNNLRSATFVVREVRPDPASRTSITIRRVLVTKDPVPMVRIDVPRGKSIQNMVFDGERIWLAADGILQDVDPQAEQRIREDAKRAYYWFSFPFVLVDPSVIVKHRGSVWIQDDEREVLEVSFRDDSIAVHAQDVRRYYVDPGTHLVVQEDYFHAGGDAPEEMLWGDYRLVDGFVKDHVREAISPHGHARLEVADIHLGAGLSRSSFRTPGKGEMPAE